MIEAADHEQTRADVGHEQLVEETHALLVVRVDEPDERVEISTILHTRISQSAAPFLLVLVSVPIGIFVRRGSRLAGLGASLPPLLTYFVLFFVFKGMGEKGRVEPVVAAYLPDAALLLLALCLLGLVYRK